MLAYLSDISAIQFWLSPTAQRARALSSIAETSKTSNSRKGNAALSLDARCVLQSEIELLAAKSQNTQQPYWQQEKNACKHVLKLHGVAPDAYKTPLLKELLDAGPQSYKLACMPENHTPAISAAEAAYINKTYGISLPLHCAVRHQNQRRRTAHFLSHLHPSLFPVQQYVLVEPGLWVASPELALFEAATIIDCSSCLGELSVLCSEFFSTYVADRTSPYGILRRQALSSPEKCLAILSKTPHDRSTRIKLLMAALKLSCARSASPFELIGTLQIKAPLSKGGYGQGRVEQNVEIDTSSYFHDGKRHYRIVDLLLPDVNIAIEFKGREAHGFSRLDDDTLREAELRATGIELISVSRSQFKTHEDTDRFMIETLSRKTGRRRISELNRYSKRRVELRNQVLYALSHKRWLDNVCTS